MKPSEIFTNAFVLFVLWGIAPLVTWCRSHLCGKTPDCYLTADIVLILLTGLQKGYNRQHFPLVSLKEERVGKAKETSPVREVSSTEKPTDLPRHQPISYPGILA